MNQASKLFRISQLLARFSEQVVILNENSEFSINIHAENVLIGILNKIYECDLVNVNYGESKNYPAIDLRDRNYDILIQVTSTSSFDKIKTTLEKVIEYDLHANYNKILIYVITSKGKSFNQNKVDEIVDGKFSFSSSNIIDKTDLYKKLNELNNLDIIDAVLALLEGQFADGVSVDKWQIYCEGIKSYDLYIENYYRYLDIKGFSPKINNNLVKISLKDVYVPLELILGEEIPGNPEGYSNTIPVTIENVLDKYNSIVILGDPGSGKSTLLKHLAYSICAKREEMSFLSKYVPVIVKGTDYAKYLSANGKNLAEYLVDHVDKKYELLFSDALSGDTLLVLFDGLDEISSVKLRHDVVDKINVFKAQYPICKLIATSRIVGYRETRLNSHFWHFKVEDFGRKQISSFINNWYAAISDYSGSPNFHAHAKELLSSIDKNKSVFRIARNPLLVTIIALIHYQGSVLPEKRVELYDAATSTFLENWVRQREVDKGNVFSRSDIIELLAPVALYMHGKYIDALIDENELKEILIEEYIKINPYTVRREAKKEIESLINFIRQDAGFIFEKGYGENGIPRFGFVHLTFQEYFASIEFVTRWKEGKYKSDIANYVFANSWREVILLAAAQFRISDQPRIARKLATDFVNDILNADDEYPSLFRSLHLACNILSDDVEIQIEKFTEIIDKVFQEVLSVNVGSEQERNDEVERQSSLFKHALGNILNSKNYQSHLLAKMEEGLKSDKHILKRNIIYILMSYSDIKSVSGLLLEYIESENYEIKKMIFGYNVVYPVAAVVTDEKFRKAIVDYVNSDLYITEYSGHLPTQYVSSFELFERAGLGGKVKFEVSYYLNAIRAVKTERIRQDLAEFIVFSIGSMNLAQLNEYAGVIASEFPNIDLKKIIGHIADLDKIAGFNLKDQEILRMPSLKLYQSLDDKHFAFVIDEAEDVVDVILFDYPLNQDLVKVRNVLQGEWSDFEVFLNNILPVLLNNENIIEIQEIGDLFSFIYFYEYIHWAYRIDVSSVFNFALDNIFEDEYKTDIVIQWLMSVWNHHSFYEKKTSFRKNPGYIRSIAESDIEPCYKLFLLKVVGERQDYEPFIKASMQGYNKLKSPRAKQVIRNILAELI